MIGTENLEEKLSQVLNDPNSMAQLMSFAQSLGMGPPDAPPPYLRPERLEKLDRAMRIARISQIAGGALKQHGGLLGGPNDV